MNDEPRIRPPVTTEKTDWQKARPYVLGIGIPVVSIAAFFLVMILLFKSWTPEVEKTIKVKTHYTEPEQPSTPTSPEPSSPVAPSRTDIYSTTTGTATTTPESDSVSVIVTEKQPPDSLVSGIDSVALKKLQEEKLQEQIEQMIQTYHERREALLNEAIAFLRGNPSERVVKNKAANFRKLGKDLRQKNKEFPKASSELEGKLWDAQKNELTKTADFLDKIANKVSNTRGDKRKMTIAANSLKSAGAP